MHRMRCYPYQMKKITSYKPWVETLKNFGVRLTLPRKTVLQVLANNREGLTPEEVCRLGRASHPGLGLVTVYRALELFEKLGMIRRVHSGGHCQSYSASFGDTHFVVCTKCGRVAEFPCCGLLPLYGHVRAKTGYNVTGHILEITGLCPSCAEHEDD